jgi:dipeptidyl aminopeptidase/acylaminoacyl peptidase
LLFHHPKVDPSYYSFDKSTNDLLSVYFDADYPDVQIINAEHPQSKWLPQLFSVFNGDTVNITSSTKDNELMVVQVEGDKTPKQFHLFNSKEKKMDYLLNSRSWIAPKEMSEVKPIEVTARDGLKLHGYFTLPNDISKDVPLIVMPHGGPHGPRDFWKYNSTVQFLASRGYAVLQVNFRGSGGYGVGFEEMGHREWGNKIQLDIIDATHWAQKQKHIAKNKTCILGASFGGYSALMAPTIAPESYQCAIGFVGVYDLALLFEEGDTSTVRFGQNYLLEVLGDDKKELAKYSPVAQVEKLQLPILLVHGEKDHRADFEHFELMKVALEKHDKDFDSLVFDEEGHGIRSEDNRAIYFSKVEDFSLKHQYKYRSLAAKIFILKKAY